MGRNEKPQPIRCLHIDYRPRVTWHYRIYNRMRETKSAALRARHRQWEATELPEQALALATKLVVLRIVVARFNENYRKLLHEISRCESEIRQHLARGTVWTLHDDEELAFRLVADIDAFIFEFRSAYEMTGKFVRGIFVLLFERNLSERELREVLEQAGLKLDWIELLQNERKLFFHDVAPWIALGVPEAGENYELLILPQERKDAGGSQRLRTPIRIQ